MRDAATETDGGNAGKWKAWKNDEAVSPPFPLPVEIDKTHSHRRDDYDGMNISLNQPAKRYAF